MVQGDLKKLAVDAVLVPCDADGNTHRGFMPLLGAVEKTTYGEGLVRVSTFTGAVRWEGRGGSGAVYHGDDAGPQVWLPSTTIQTRVDADGLFAAAKWALPLAHCPPTARGAALSRSIKARSACRTRADFSGRARHLQWCDAAMPYGTS